MSLFIFKHDTIYIDKYHIYILLEILSLWWSVFALKKIFTVPWTVNGITLCFLFICAILGSWHFYPGFINYSIKTSLTTILPDLKLTIFFHLP